MARVRTPPQLRAPPRIRLRRLRRSCLYDGPDRRSPPGPEDRDRRRHCRYTLATVPPLFGPRRR